MKSNPNFRAQSNAEARSELAAGSRRSGSGRPSRTLRWLGVAAGLVSATVAAAPAEPSKSDGGDVGNLALSIQRATLDNGLRVVLNVDRSSPNMAVSALYDVGSRKQVPVRIGFARLFEHMMFQGSKNVGIGQHLK